MQGQIQKNMVTAQTPGTSNQSISALSTVLPIPTTTTSDLSTVSNSSTASVSTKSTSPTTGVSTSPTSPTFEQSSTVPTSPTTGVSTTPTSRTTGVSTTSTSPTTGVSTLPNSPTSNLSSTNLNTSQEIFWEIFWGIYISTMPTSPTTTTGISTTPTSPILDPSSTAPTSLTTGISTTPTPPTLNQSSTAPTSPTTGISTTPTPPTLNQSSTAPTSPTTGIMTTPTPPTLDQFSITSPSPTTGISTTSTSPTLDPSSTSPTSPTTNISTTPIPPILDKFPTAPTSPTTGLSNTSRPGTSPITPTPTSTTSNLSISIRSSTPTTSRPPNVTTPSAPVRDIYHPLSFSLAINEDFDFQLTDQSSTKYKTYNSEIRSSIDASYIDVSGYQANSAAVTGFRPGSVITDFTINATSDNLNLASANQQLESNLRSQGFNVAEISRSVKDGLYNGSATIYPGINLTLTCTPPVNNGIKWTMNGKEIQPSDKYTINNNMNIVTVHNVTPSDSGQYACTTIVNSVPYIIWQFITIQPYPNIQVTNNKIVKCEDTTIPLQCCVQMMYQVQWIVKPAACVQPSTGSPAGCLLCDYIVNKQDCQTTNQVIEATCQLEKPISRNHYPKSFKINVINKEFTCSDSVFGAGDLGDVNTAECNTGTVGTQKAKCNASGLWDPIENNCVLRVFQDLKDEAQTLQVNDIAQFMGILSGNVSLEIQNITGSQATIKAIVEILTIVSNLLQTVEIDQSTMMDFLQIVDAFGSVDAQDSWVLLNENNASANASSDFLNSTEIFASRLVNSNFSRTTNSTFFMKTLFVHPFSQEFGINSTTEISVPEIIAPTFITIIISSAFNIILPVRNLTNNGSSQTGTKINGDVALIVTNSTINNISLSFDLRNETLGNPQCVFWNFSLLNGIGGWDTTGCQLKPLGNETERYTCECNHTTSFSILMSPFSLEKDKVIILGYITYIGVGISMASLVLCIIIEIIIWKSVTRNDTSYMRHVSVTNVAVSLLIANICFIIGAAVVKKGVGPCSTATFFMHFFYLALFFWMLLSALLLLYRTLMVFSRMSRGTMMAIAFTVGYGAPLIIAVVTVASTAGSKGYIQKDHNCWLNWNKTKALLAFVIPALTIVAINLLVLIVVLYKMLRRGINASTQPGEKHPLVVIARCVGILTPLFGLTWGFGIGTMVSSDFGIHVVFAFLNSLQGFFILVFGTLLDSKVREELAGKLSLRNLTSNRTRSTTSGPSSSSGLPFINRLRQRHAYNVSNGETFPSSISNAAADS
ncbi:adhesion G protein-coupled receptor F5-like isoform X2 [Neoarius graeffei]|nr:adhesion G protein-coupled receptor F5-like isoform X2 [Neoarius graeffei]